MILMNDCLLYYLAFSHFAGIGPIKFKLLKKYFGSVKKAYSASKKELIEVIGLDLSMKFVDYRNRFNPSEKLEELRKKEITILASCDANYPISLRNISDPPICIYIKGSVKALSSSLIFSIVGTRSPTPYGFEVARRFTSELTKVGFTIVSGLAYGIDTIVHRTCIENGGKTVAVLGCGVDVVYPVANSQLYKSIILSKGAIVSEFPPGQTVVKGLFVARNRIISALSSGVMIVEGAKNSGSLITARYAAEQGKEVFAPPNPITSPMSIAPNMLLKQGAKLVTEVEDILEEYDEKLDNNKK